jgi:hypothetical protein
VSGAVWVRALMRHAHPSCVMPLSGAQPIQCSARTMRVPPPPLFPPRRSSSSCANRAASSTCPLVSSPSAVLRSCLPRCQLLPRPTPHCLTHGGGRRCQQEGCTTAVVQAPGSVFCPACLRGRQAVRTRSDARRATSTSDESVCTRGYGSTPRGPSGWHLLREEPTG